MAVTVTERFSGPRFERGEDSIAAVREYDVSGVSDASSALTAEDATSGLTIPSYNDGHPQNSFVRVYNKTAQQRSPNLYRVRVRYKIPRNKGEHNEPNDDPLSQPPTLRWRMGAQDIIVDTDASGNAIVSSAQEPFATDPRDIAPDYSLIVSRNEPFYDPFFAKEMHLAVNSDDLYVSSIKIATPGHARLMRMAPSSEYRVTTDYVTVEYEFELREDLQNQPAEVNPFWIRVLDQGYRAFNDSLEPALLYDKDNNRPTEPVLLNGAGQPLDDKWRVGEDNSVALTLTPPGDVVVENYESGGELKSVWLWYKPRFYKEKAFSKLGL